MGEVLSFSRLQSGFKYGACENGTAGIRKPVVLEYEISEEAWDSLRVLRFENYSEEWAKFILLNRNNPSDQPVHDYDVVIGPIADDRVGVQLWKYENHSIDLPTLVRNLQYMKGVTIQYFSVRNVL